MTDHPNKVNATQRQALERLYERGSMRLAGRNTPASMARGTAGVLMRLGFARLSQGNERCNITESGRRRVQEWRRLDGHVGRP